jgi:hypothetical protein
LSLRSAVAQRPNHLTCAKTGQNTLILALIPRLPAENPSKQGILKDASLENFSFPGFFRPSRRLLE